MWPSVNVISMGDNYDGSSLLGSRGSTRQIYFRYSAAATFAMFGPVLASHPKVRPLPWRQGRGLPPIITTSSRYNKHFPEARAVITSPLLMAYIMAGDGDRSSLGGWRRACVLCTLHAEPSAVLLRGEQSCNNENCNDCPLWITSIHCCCPS